MEARETIDELRLSVEHIAAEDELLGIIVDRLTALRQVFRSQRFVFTPGDIEFLKSLARLSDHLCAFVELREEAVDVGSVKEYEEILTRLTRTKSAFADLPVGKRVAKAIRELEEKLPAIRQNDEANRQFRLGARIHILEQNPRLCPRGHRMVIRTGKSGEFWGCTQFPWCWKTAQLTPQQGDLLTLPKDI
jgi:hypothetical protein